VRAAHEAAARLAAMGEQPAQPAEDDEDERAFREHLRSVGPGSWISVPLGGPW
jgi:hypothetical protein